MSAVLGFLAYTSIIAGFLLAATMLEWLFVSLYNAIRVFHPRVTSHYNAPQTRKTRVFDFPNKRG